MDDVVTKDCIVVVVPSPRDSPEAMATQNTSSSSSNASQNASSSSSNTNMVGAANTAGTGQRPTKKPRSRAKPSSSNNSKPAVKKKKKTAVATSNAPSNVSQPSSSAAGAAKQLGLAASASADPAATASSGPSSAHDRPLKRTYVQAFPRSQGQGKDDVAQPSRPTKEQPKKPEYPRRAAPADAISQPCFEVMSIHSEDEYSSDSDEPLIEGQKRRINSKASSHSVGEQNTAQSGPQASTHVQSLAQQLTAARATCRRVTQEKEDASEQASRLQKQVDDMQKQLADMTARRASMIATIKDSRQKENAAKDTAAARISELERENRHVSEMNVNTKIKYGQLQARHSMLQNEYNQKTFDHEQLHSSHKQLDANYKQLGAENKRLEVENKQFQDEVERLMQKDQAWQQTLDERLAMEEKWRLAIDGISKELYSPRGSGRAPR